MKRKLGYFATSVALAFAGTSQAATVMNGSFEDTPGFNPGRNWQVFSAIEGWTTTNGAGVEIQSNQTLRQIDAQNGNHYVELDSHGRNSNSRITQMVDLDQGRYELSFFYAPRTHRTGSNGIEFSVGDLVFGSVSGPNNEYKRFNWHEVTAKFDVRDSGLYALSFAATGRQDSLGGLIDNVSLVAVPLPASALLLLGSLGALGAARRKSKG